LVVSYLLWHDDAQASWRLSLWSAASVLIIATVAFSRMYLGFHFLTDVLAGACVAVVVLGVVVGAERWHDLALEHRDPPARSTPLARTSGDAVGTYEEDLAARWDEGADEASAASDGDAPTSREENEGARSQ
jgi:undecaprenyl-diphosphatase